MKYWPDEYFYPASFPKFHRRERKTQDLKTAVKVKVSYNSYTKYLRFICNLKYCTQIDVICYVILALKLKQCVLNSGTVLIKVLLV